jgi:hypothetical protein
MNQTKRVSQRMSDVLGVIKSFDKAAGGCPEGLDGIKAEAQAAYRDFVTNKYGIDGVDEIQAYVPCSLIHQFAEADITSQALAKHQLSWLPAIESKLPSTSSVSLQIISPQQERRSEALSDA